MAKRNDPLEEKILPIYGIGPKLAGILSSKLKTWYKGQSVMQIRARLKQKDVWNILPIAAQADLEHNPLKKIPRSDLEKIDTILHKQVSGIHFQIAGSYRRGKPISRDVDIVMSTGKSIWQTVWSKFRKMIGNTIDIYEPYASGPGKISVFMRLNGHKRPIKVDVFLTTPSEYMFALLYATGSGQFNIRMRAVAKKRGYLLNQKGLWKDGIRVPIKNEKDLFKKLNMTYQSPSQRYK
jgi:DNA polymerase/3'-5' exonuclease PolX